MLLCEEPCVGRGKRNTCCWDLWCWGGRAGHTSLKGPLNTAAPDCVTRALDSQAACSATYVHGVTWGRQVTLPLRALAMVSCGFNLSTVPGIKAVLNKPSLWLPW